MQLTPDKWPCGECLCDADGNGPDYYKIPGVLDRTKKCLRQMVTPFTWLMLEYHGHYIQGNLAVGGGITDQPGAYLDAMAIITEWQEYGKRSDS